MGWLVGQVWILSAGAFAAGAAAMWLAFGRPRRRPGPVGWAYPGAAWAGPRDVATEDPTPVEPPPPPPPPPTRPATDPALAALGSGLDGLQPQPGAAAAAAGVLDLLGIAPAARPAGSADAGPDVGAPAGPQRAAPELPDGTPPTGPDGAAPEVPDETALVAPDEIAPAGPDGAAPEVPDQTAPAGPDGAASEVPDQTALVAADGAAPAGPDGISAGDLVEDGPTTGSFAEEQRDPVAEDDPQEGPRTGAPADPPPREREVSTGDIPAQGGPVDVPLHIPAQAGPRENWSGPNGSRRT